MAKRGICTRCALPCSARCARCWRCRVLEDKIAAAQPRQCDDCGTAIAYRYRGRFWRFCRACMNRHVLVRRRLRGVMPRDKRRGHLNGAWCGGRITACENCGVTKWSKPSYIRKRKSRLCNRCCKVLLRNGRRVTCRYCGKDAGYRSGWAIKIGKQLFWCKRPECIASRRANAAANRKQYRYPSRYRCNVCGGPCTRCLRCRKCAFEDRHTPREKRCMECNCVFMGTPYAKSCPPCRLRRGRDNWCRRHGAFCKDCGRLLVRVEHKRCWPCNLRYVRSLRPKWCRDCGIVWNRHFRRGLCHNCYRRERYRHGKEIRPLLEAGDRKLDAVSSALQRSSANHEASEKGRLSVRRSAARNAKAMARGFTANGEKRRRYARRLAG